MLLKREDELDLEEEAMELEPLFSRGEATAQPYGEKKWGQALACPSPTRVTVAGFSRYSNSVASLPGSEQIGVKNVASLILRSFRPGCQPIVAVRIVGHADYDPFGERSELDLMLKISRARALAVKQALERLINNRAISSRIAWDVRGVGASQLVVPNPTTEAGRRHNRRVEIWLRGEKGTLDMLGENAFRPPLSETLAFAGGRPTPAGGGGGGVTIIEPFPTTPLAPRLVDNGTVRIPFFDTPISQRLNTAMSALAADPDTRGMCVAVVVFSPILNPILGLFGQDGLYQGFNDDDMLYVGSLQKISAMYAAFELRSRVRRHVADALAKGPITLGQILNDLRTAWQPNLDAAFPKLPGLPKLPSGFPDLENIFTFSTSGDVNFSSSGQTQAQLDRIDGAGSVAGLKFFECLKLMLGWSNNHAAAKCILALSYPYINGVLKGAGFFDPGSKTGLWLSGNYAFSAKDWLPDKTADDANAGQPKTPRWATLKRPTTNFGATARQVAHLLALIGLNKLVDPSVDATANGEMRALLSGAELNTRIPLPRNLSLSYVELALREAGRSFDKVFSKIGIGDDGTIHDCGIVERTVAGAKSSYVVVGLGSPNNINLISKLFVEIDKAT
jgi:hypothetical protein